MRYLKITLSGTLLFLVYLWVSVLFNSCNSKPAENASDTTEILEEEMDDLDYTESDAEFEGEEDDSFDAKPEVEETETDTYEEEDDYEAGDYTSDEPSRERTFPSTTASESSGNTSLTPRKKRSTTVEEDVNPYEADNTGDYMVIAGSYLLEDNAKRMVDKLQGMGYSNAEIVYFDQSQYHSICAGKYDSQRSASKTASSLKSSGIDSYVHRRQ